MGPLLFKHIFVSVHMIPARKMIACWKRQIVEGQGHCRGTSVIMSNYSVNYQYTTKCFHECHSPSSMVSTCRSPESGQVESGDQGDLPHLVWPPATLFKLCLFPGFQFFIWLFQSHLQTTAATCFHLYIITLFYFHSVLVGYKYIYIVDIERI